MASGSAPAWVSFEPWLPEGGDVQRIEWKCRKFSDGDVLWECRRILPIFIRRQGSDIVVGKAIKRDLAAWVCWTEELYGERLYYASERAAAATGSSAPGDDYSEREWTMTSLGVCTLLLWAMRRRRNTIERQASRAALLGMLRGVVGIGDAVRSVFLEQPAAAFAHCRREAEEDGPCRCSALIAELAAVPQGDADASWGRIGDYLMAMYVASRDCEAIRFWLGYVLFEALGV